jgi:hypothetical protein
MKTQVNTKQLSFEVQNKKFKHNHSFDAGLRMLGIHQGLIKVKGSAPANRGIDADCEQINS